MLLLTLGALGLFFFAPVHAEAKSMAATSASQSQTADTVIYYKLVYYNDVEWVEILPQQLGPDQTYWICYPAALVFYSDGTVNIPGQWEAYPAVDALIYSPSISLESNQSYTGQQQVNLDYASYGVPSTSFTSYPTYTDPWADGPDWARPDYLDPNDFTLGTDIDPAYSGYSGD
jgi:hypothetical protein